MRCGVVLWWFWSEWRETLTRPSSVYVLPFSVPGRRFYRSFRFEETVVLVLVAFPTIVNAFFGVGC